MDDYTDNAYEEQDDSAMSERDVQKQLFAEFNAARKTGDLAEAERIARMFLDYPWKEQPATSGAFAMRLFIERTDAAQREKEGHDNICILRKCLYKKWNYNLALSTLEEIDRLREAGWNVCADDRELIAGCRMRCEEHVEAEKKEARWTKLCGDLRDAVRKRDAAAVARILSAPEFRNREPDDESLLWRAERLLNRRSYPELRLKLLPVIAIVALLVVVLGVSARKTQSRLFDEKCVAEVEKLSALRETFDPIEQIATELSYLQHEDPDVLADPRVFAYFDILENMKAENLARTNEIVSLLTELDAVAKDNWNSADQGTVGKIERVDELLKSHDILYARRLNELKESAIACAETKRDTRRKDAEKYVLRLRPILNSVAQRLESELPDDELTSLAEKCGEALNKWDTNFAKGAGDLNDGLADARRRFHDARARQSAAVSDLATFKAAVRAMDILAIRDHLRSAHSVYAPIASLAPLPYSANDVRDVLNGLAANLVVQDGAKLAPIGIRRVFSAGKIQFDPLGRAYRRNKASIVPHVVAPSTPLYVLRKEDGNLVLRRALVPSKGKWGIVSQAVKDELILGEPLFQIR